MSTVLLGVPVMVLRYGLMGLVSKHALERAGRWPPTRGVETAAQAVVEISSLVLFAYLFFARARLQTVLNWAGLAAYVVGAALYAKSVVDYARPRADGLNTNGLYMYSRNPMYVAFFLHLLGLGLMIDSWFFVAVLLVYQAANHFLILAEERWCIAMFGEDYTLYMNRVRRYI
ncbi:MAG: hypothetical protein BWY85_00909 [Firmicutes bacterium ADurb.Bin506]|jgi:protein-S-isoprenylcysteine O-methyltransferase Ste14|nr:MAG: hypothetical protein BWY85_00909 [Firmicutes bacterium ADurb.Bin506]